MVSDKWTRALEAARVRQFEWAALPRSWRFTSSALKHAADHLYDIHFAALHRQVARVVAESEESQRTGTTSASRVLEGAELRDSHDVGLFGPYLLLMGYALENLLKGVLLIQHPEYFNGGELREIKTHNLRSLCERSEFRVTEKERWILEQLTRSIEWAGKYPAPLRLRDFPSVGHPPNSSREEPMLSQLAGDWREALDALWTRMMDSLVAHERERGAAPSGDG